MQRADMLRDLVARGTGTSPERCRELAGELGLLVSDVLTIAGHPVPPVMLPPDRDARVLKQTAYRLSYCDHELLAALTEFIHGLPVAAPDPTPRGVGNPKIFPRPEAAMHCHHLGRVLMAAIPLSTPQLIEVAEQADRLSERRDQGAWQPYSEGGAAECPDIADLAGHGPVP